MSRLGNPRCLSARVADAEPTAWPKSFIDVVSPEGGSPRSDRRTPTS